MAKYSQHIKKENHGKADSKLSTNTKSTKNVTIKTSFFESKYILPAILLITFIVFFRSIGNDFVLNWDDENYIMKNPYIQDLSWQNIKAIFSEFYASNYHPLTTLSLGLDYSIFGTSAKPFHIINLLLHIINTALVFFLIKMISKRIEIAVIVAFLFGIHPMHVESVVWISERKDLLYSLFFILSSIFYLKYITECKLKHLIACFVFFLLSCFSKSAAVTLPVILLLLDYLLLRKFTSKTIIEKIPFFLLSLLFGILAILSQKSGGAIQNLTEEFSYGSRILLISWSVMVYFLKLFIPVNLSAFYYYPVSSESMGVEYYMAPLVFILFIIFIIKLKAYRRELIFGILFFLTGLSVILHFIPVGGSIVSERYTYIPYIGLFFIIAKFYNDVFDAKFPILVKYKLPLLLLLALGFLSFSIISFTRIPVWKNGTTLFTDVIEKNPGGDFGYQYRGVAKALAGDFQGCIEDQNKALEINPKYPEAYYSRGLAKMTLKDFKSAFDDFQKATEFIKEYPDAYNNMGNIMLKYKQFDKALNYYDMVLKYNPQHSLAFYNKGACYYYLKDMTKACEFWSKSSALGYQKADEMKNKFCK